MSSNMEGSNLKNKTFGDIEGRAAEVVEQLEQAKTTTMNNKRESHR